MGICNLSCVDIGKGEVKAKKCLDICRDFGIIIYAVCQQKVNMQWYRRGHNEHDWKSCCRQKRHEGSNPSHCAILSDQNRCTHLKPLRNQGFQRFYALFFQSVFYRYARANIKAAAFDYNMSIEILVIVVLSGMGSRHGAEL